MDERKQSPSLPILLVDDEATTLRVHEIALSNAGYTNIISCQDSRQALNLLREEEACVIILDLNMPGISGQQLLDHFVAEFPETPVIVITSNDDVKTVVECMKKGAFDYLVKPVTRSRLQNIVRRAIEIQELRQENSQLKEKILNQGLTRSDAFSKILTNNKTMLAIFQYVESIAISSQPLLITGETGVGKELMAKAVHTISNREGNCVFVNVAGIDDNAFSDTLFGHVRGAFTGAEKQRAGLVERAGQGTLVLDEIGDLCKESQVKLLRLLQEGEYFPLGADRSKVNESRIVVSTNIDLTRAQQEGTFRKDLYYRLRAHHIELPPLRQRKEDIHLLFEHFLSEAAQALQKPKPLYPDQLIDLLLQYHFPGNIRELRAMVFDGVGSARNRSLSMDSFYAHLERHKTDTPATGTQSENHPTDIPLSLSGPLPTLKEASDLLIREAMLRTNNNQSMAARLLGISRQTLARNLKSIQTG